MKKIICCDFDGVIHSYRSGWKGPRNIPDPPVAGAIEWIEEFIMTHCTIPDSIAAMNHEGECEFHIYSSRSKSFGGRRAMKKWLIENGLDKRFLEAIKFPSKKPAAFVTIDDRVIRFDGEFPSFHEVVNFKPRMKIDQTFVLQNESQCQLCSGCENDQEFDYCRNCGYTKNIEFIKEDSQKSQLTLAVEKARGGPTPPPPMQGY